MALPRRQLEPLTDAELQIIDALADLLVADLERRPALSAATDEAEQAPRLRAVGDRGAR